MGRPRDKKTARIDMRLTESQKARYRAYAGKQPLVVWFTELAEAEIDRRQWRAWKKRQNPDPREEMLRLAYPGRHFHEHSVGAWCDVCGKIVG